MKKTFNYKYSYILFIIFLLWCCNNRNEEVSPVTAMIQIDSVYLPKAKTDKVIPEFIAYYKEQYLEKPPVDSLKKIVHLYCDDLYFAADALNKKYDTITEVQEAYQWVIQFLAVEIYNKFQEDQVNDAPIPDEDMDIAFERRKYIYHTDIIQFRCKEEAKELLNIDLKPDAINKQNFDEILETLKQKDPFKVSSVAIRWPFLQICGINDEFYGMKEGELKGPILYSADIFYVRLNSVEEIYQSNKENEYDRLKKDLIKARSIKYRLNSIEKILEQAKISYNEKNIEKYIKSLVWTKYDQNENEKVYTLADFQWNNEHHPINSDQLYSFFTYNKVQMPFTTTVDIREWIEIYVLHFYLYQYAMNMNIDKETEYKIQKDVSLYNALIQYYLQNDIMDKISVSAEEVQKFYDENTHIFTEAEVVYLTEISFESRLTAMYNLKKIQQAATSNNLKKLQYKDYLPGLKKIAIHQTVKYNNDRFTPEEINYLFRMQNMECSPLWEKDESYIYLIKEGESGQRIQGLEETKVEIENMVWQDKLIYKKDSALSGLKQKYPIADHIDYDHFLNK